MFTAEAPIETTHVPYIGQDMPYYLATAFFAILAYPLEKEYSKRDDLVSALHAWRAKTAWKKGYLTKQKIDRSLMDLPTQQMRNRFSMASARIEKRLEAADLASHVALSKNFKISVKDGFAKRLSLSIDLTSGQLIKPNDGKGQSLTKVIEEYAHERDMDSAHTKKSVWSASKPVLHLASQFRWALLDFARKSIELNGQDPPIPWDLTLMLQAADDWVFDCVEKAEKSRIFFSNLQGIDPARTVKLTFDKS